MELRKLGNSGIDVTVLSLGTMNFGSQIDTETCYAILDQAIGSGINMIDTAELYPVPPESRSYGKSEEIIGSWLKARSHDKRPFITTKVCGPSYVAPQSAHVRGGSVNLDKGGIVNAVNASLTRLGIDYVDHLLLHWPSRKVPIFGKNVEIQDDTREVPIDVTVSVLADLVREGKIGSYGLSNETPWGLCKFIAVAGELGVMGPSSIQNSYNLLNRTPVYSLAEVCYRESIGFMAYSPLAFGALTGKYIHSIPDRSRLGLWPRFSRYNGKRARDATLRYITVAQQYGFCPAQGAIAYIASQPFISTVVLGVSTVTQLTNNISSLKLTLAQDVLDLYAAIDRDIPLAAM